MHLETNEIVETARSYLGTKFHHQARLKHVGIDCVGLVICVARELNLIDQTFDYTAYSRVPDGKILIHEMNNHLDEITRDEGKPGDIICVSFDKYPQHVGIIGNYRHGGLSIIHASGKHGSVVETRLMYSQDMKYVGTYRFRS
jgi:uncharacterized protein YijF (DUF1287 family)